jgi:hypothetical protein
MPTVIPNFLSETDRQGPRLVAYPNQFVSSEILSRALDPYNTDSKILPVISSKHLDPWLMQSSAGRFSWPSPSFLCRKNKWGQKLQEEGINDDVWPLCQVFLGSSGQVSESDRFIIKEQRRVIGWTKEPFNSCLTSPSTLGPSCKTGLMFTDCAGRRQLLGQSTSMGWASRP